MEIQKQFKLDDNDKATDAGDNDQSVCFNNFRKNERNKTKNSSRK